MKRHRTALQIGVAAALAIVAQTQAAITTSVTLNSTNGPAGVTAWPSSFTDKTTGANPGTDFTVAENNYGAAALFSLGTSWTATIGGSLSDLQIMISGTAPVSFNLSLFDGGTTGWADIGAGTYDPGVNVSGNLFADTSLQTWNGYTLPGANAAVLDFALSGADQVAIIAGHQYIFEISSSSNPNGLIWFRNGATGNYTGGQAFRQRSPLNGNPARDMSLAVQYVPEPSTLALLGLGTLIGTFVIRRGRKS